MRNTTEEMIAVIQAIKTDAVIERAAAALISDKWRVVESNLRDYPDFQLYRYRVRPEPRRWVIQKNQGFGFNIEQIGSLDCPLAPGESIEVVEVER